MSVSPPLAPRRIAPTLVAALGLLIAHRADAASMYGVTDFGANVSSLRLNNPGQVAGLRSSTDGSSQSGFLYTAGTYTDLPNGVQPISLAGDGRVIDGRGPYSFYLGSQMDRNRTEVGGATAGNHSGILVGSFHYSPYATPNGWWDNDAVVSGNFIYKPSQNGTYSRQFLDTVAGHLHAVSGTYYANDPTGRGEMIASYGASYRPTGINDSNQVVGTDYSNNVAYAKTNPAASVKMSEYETRAVLNGQGLGTLGGRNSQATAINNAGQVTGQADTAGGAGHAFLYTAGKMVDLGLLAGMTSSTGLGLNEKGDVVGSSGGHAFLYSKGIMEDLNDRLPATSGLTLDEAFAINDAGQILAHGHGADGVEHGLLLSPVPTPEPTALALLGLVAAGYGVRRLRNPKS